MNIIHVGGGTFTLNFSKGEEVLSGLVDFVQSKKITAGHITGLGAASRLTIAYYNIGTKEYEKKEFDEEVEILSLTGNIGMKESGESVVHLHGVFGRRDFSVFGGHIFELVISGAGELHIATFSGTINRKYDEASGLTLMCPIDFL